MSITFATSIGLPANAPEGSELPWLDAADGSDLTWSTSAMTARDILLAVGLEEDEEASTSDNVWPIAEIGPKLKALLDSPENDGDYPFAQASRLFDVVERGAAEGAVFVLAA